MRLVQVLHQVQRGHPHVGRVVGVRASNNLTAELAIYLGLRPHLAPSVLYADADTNAPTGKHAAPRVQAQAPAESWRVGESLRRLGLISERTVDYLDGGTLPRDSWDKVLKAVDQVYPVVVLCLPGDDTVLDLLCDVVVDTNTNLVTTKEETKALPEAPLGVQAEIDDSDGDLVQTPRPEVDAYLGQLADMVLGQDGRQRGGVESKAPKEKLTTLARGIIRRSLYPADNTDGVELETWLQEELPDARAREILLTLLGDSETVSPKELLDLVVMAQHLA